MAKVFYDRKYFDGWGTGIIKIFDLCRANDIPKPEYEQYSGGVESGARKDMFNKVIKWIDWHLGDKAD